VVSPFPGRQAAIGIEGSSWPSRISWSRERARDRRLAFDAGRNQDLALVGRHGVDGVGDIDQRQVMFLRGRSRHRLLPALVKADLFALGLADVADVGVAQDGVEPGTEIGAFLELVLMGPGPQHCLLHKVVDEIAAAGTAPGEALQGGAHGVQLGGETGVVGGDRHLELPVVGEFKIDPAAKFSYSERGPMPGGG